MAVGMAAVGYTAIAEIQFGDYIFPAFDQVTDALFKPHRLFCETSRQLPLSQSGQPNISTVEHNIAQYHLD